MQDLGRRMVWLVMALVLGGMTGTSVWTVVAAACWFTGRGRPGAFRLETRASPRSTVRWGNR